tara:strand:+ start:2120 stop:2263 length:144 start_codon:yes stop_codon:yes gene_type:complete
MIIQTGFGWWGIWWGADPTRVGFSISLSQWETVLSVFWVTTTCIFWL